jgi:hypothetical protein
MIKHYFTAAFLLDTGVGVYSIGDRALLYLHCALLLGAIALSFFVRAEKNRTAKYLLRRWATLLYTIGIVGLIWSVMREQGIVILSSHVIIMAIYLVAAFWTAAIIRYMATDYQILAEAHRKEEERLKYIPKPHK